MHLAIRPLHVAIFVAIMAIWGLNFVVGKIGLEQLPPLLMMALRWVLVAVMLAPFVARPKGRWREVMRVSFPRTVHDALGRARCSRRVENGERVVEGKALERQLRGRLCARELVHDPRAATLAGRGDLGFFLTQLHEHVQFGQHLHLAPTTQVLELHGRYPLELTHESSDELVQ